MFTTTLGHIIVVPDTVLEENCSFFQRYSYEILENYQWIFDALAVVPHDILEPFLDSYQYAVSKISGSSLDVSMIRSDLLIEAHIHFDREFNILWSTPETFKQAKDMELLFKYKPMHITSFETKSAHFIKDFTSKKLNEEIKKYIFKTIGLLGNNTMVDEISNIVNSQNKKQKIKFDFNPLNHNCTRPLYKTLTGYGYYAEDFEDIQPSNDVNQHVNGMINLSNLISNIREKLEVKNNFVKNDVIIYCMSMCSFLYKQNSMMWNEIYRKMNKNQRDFLKSSIIRNKFYSNSSIEVNENFNPYSDPILSGLLKIRQSELSLFSSVTSILAVNQFAPALRLPNAVMLHHDLLKNISSLISNPNKKTHRNLNKKLMNYSDVLKNEIGTELLFSCLSNKNKLFTMCDFPIEWISLNGFPIMFTHEISRVPTTPGNLCSQLALSGQRLILPYDTFKDVLIISSFDSSDPIKNHLKSSLEYYKKNKLYEKLNIIEVSISSEVELIEVLNSFEGWLVVFDCHGNHGGETENGWLCIGDDKVDTWSLANQCRIPPIVILSACSTHPIDGSHASVANGLFRCGAISVIGTYAPIRADHAGQFVARLLYRVAAFIPVILKTRTISWREVISGFLKMSYSTDVLMHMTQKIGLLNKEQYRDIHFQINHIINTNTPEWTDKLVVLIVEKTGRGKSEIIKLISENFQFVDTMLYSQLGRPENIIICE